MLRIPPAYYRSRDPVHNLKIKVSIRKTHQKRPAQAKVVGRGGIGAKQPDASDSSSDESSSDEDEGELKRASSDEPNSSDDEDQVAEKDRRHAEKIKKRMQEREKRKAAKRKKKEQKKRERKKKKKPLGNGEDEAEAGSAEGGDADPDIGKAPWEAVFSWQEKEFSPRELLLYRPEDHAEGDLPKRKKSKHHNIVERGYEHELSLRSKGETKVEAGSMHLFTYTDKDGFVPGQLFSPATVSSTDIQHVGRALVALPKRNEKHGQGHNKKSDSGGSTSGGAAGGAAGGAGGDPRGDPVTARLRRENNCKTMYIMACVDTTQETLSSNTPEFFEVPLCAIRYYEQGRMLEVTPPLAKPTYTLTGTTQHPSRTDPKTAEQLRGLPGGAMGTYRFSTASGAQYEYTLSNASEVVNRDIADELRKVELAEVEREMNELSNMIGHRFERGAEGDDQLRLFAYCEVVSAQRFDSDRLYVQYQLALPVQGDWLWPPEWDKYEIERRRTGSTQISTIGYSGGVSDASGQDGVSIVYPVAHFGYPFELQCIHTEKKGEDAMMSGDWPRLFLEVGSSGCWGRHYVEGYGHVAIPRVPGTYDLTVNTWKPRGAIRDRMSDFFLGGARHLSDHVNYSAHPNPADRGPFLNKYGFTTESSGQVRVRINVVVQRKEQPKPKEDEESYEANKKERTIQEIFDSVTLGKSMTIKEALGKPQANHRARLNNLYDSLRSSTNSAALPRTPGARS